MTTTAKKGTARGASRRGIPFDPRLAIGLLLVAGSVAGVVAIVSTADETVEVYTARDALSPGDRIEPADLTTTSVRLADAGELYLLPGEMPRGGFVVTRSVNEGELVPASAVGSVDGMRLTSIVLDISGSLAESVRSGALVDVWASREVENGQFGPPAVIVSGATVARLVESDSIVAGGQTTGVEMLVPKSKVARLLEAVANSDAMSIVPATLPGRG